MLNLTSLADMPMTSITSVEVNFLVFRYLQESGFIHTAFSLGYEAGIYRCTIDGNMVPPGALITLVQKGLQYLEMEANLCNSDSDMDEDFSILQPMDLITKNIDELQKIVKEKKELHKTKEKNKDIVREHENECTRVREKDRLEKEKDLEKENERTRVREKVKQEKDKDLEKDREKLGKGNEREKRNAIPENATISVDQFDKVNVKQEDGGTCRARGTGDIAVTSTIEVCDINSCDVTILEGHTSEVCACAWSPAGSLLASGSGDSTARIWKIADEPCKSSSRNGAFDVLVLNHVRGRASDRSKDVTTLDWNAEGTLLATGSYDGQARIWNTTGELRCGLSKHRGPVFSLKWNKRGDYLLTGSCDTTAIVWDVKAREWKQQFEFHSGPILDVDWRNNVSFATSSTDSMIYVCKVGENRPFKTFSCHKGEVNCVKWDPTGSLLASCSDDMTAKIWSLRHDNCVHDLKQHAKEIYTIRWSPTGPGTPNPNQQLVLASASFDATIKIWEAEQGRLLYTLQGHKDPVYSVAFSPSGEYLASGSLDRSLHVWSLKERRIVKSYGGNGGIFEVCWNKEGNKIAACFANHTVCVLDFRM